jgi:hypothetical protein
MVALIDNDLAVFCDKVFHPCFVVSALDDGNVYATTAAALPTKTTRLLGCLVTLK